MKQEFDEKLLEIYETCNPEKETLQEDEFNDADRAFDGTLKTGGNSSLVERFLDEGKNICCKENLNRLVESTELADIGKLDAQLETDKALNKLLKTPAKDLPAEYKYLVEEIYEEDADKTLYYLIQESCRRLKSTSFFSAAGDKIVGFFAYIIGEGNKVDEIKMFSFDLTKSNPVLAGDLLKLIKNLQQKYVEINWCAVKENPANDQYKRIVDKLNGSVKDVSERVCRYTVPGKKRLSTRGGKLGGKT